MDFWKNLSKKCSVLFFVSVAILFVIWFLDNVHSVNEAVHKNYIDFFKWLWTAWQTSWSELSLTSINIFVVTVALIPLLVLVVCLMIKGFCILGKYFAAFIEKVRIFWRSEWDEKKSLVCRWLGLRIRTIRTIKNVFIELVFLSWLGYAVFRSNTLLSGVNYLVESLEITDVNAVEWADLFAEMSLKLGFASTIFIIFFEIVIFFGWDYLRFGSRSFYKGGLHWYEQEEKYLGEGDYSYGGKLVYKICMGIDWVFGEKVFDEGDGKVVDKLKYVIARLIHVICGWVNKLLQLKNKRTLGEYLYQCYILVRYNSLMYRIVNIGIIVFVLLNLWHLLHGGIPSWSYWWDSESRVADFINSSTTLQIFLKSPLDNLSFLILFGLIVEKEPRTAFFKSFLYERLNGVIVVVSTIVAILLVLANVAQNNHNLMAGLLFADALFTVVFLIEIGLKIYEAGSKFFFKDNSENIAPWLRMDWWNITDAFVVLASITSIFMLKDEYQHVEGMLAMIILRVIRLLKLVRLLKMFKKYLANLFDGVKHAMIKSIPIIMIFAICLMFLGFVLYLFSSEWGIGEKYFENPIKSVFSLFQLFTYDGWHQITTDVVNDSRDHWDQIWWIDPAVRIGFCALVFAGGIVGVALLNSVFVDGMLLRDKSDEDRSRRLNELNRKIEEISTKLDDMEKRQSQSSG